MKIPSEVKIPSEAKITSEAKILSEVQGTLIVNIICNHHVAWLRH